MANSDQPSANHHGWDERALRDPHRQRDKATRVQAMFNAIAGTYERINTLATFGRDAVWRRQAVAAADVRSGDVILDVACGTGDMIRAFARQPAPATPAGTNARESDCGADDGRNHRNNPKTAAGIPTPVTRNGMASSRPAPARIIGVDFAREMLTSGDYSGVNVPVQLIQADALEMPLPDESVDVISCAFGVRNFQDLQAGLREMHRVARPGARVVILEFAASENRLLRWLNERYCRLVLPCLGALVAHDRVGAYRYLPRSVEVFESVQSMVQRMLDTGFVNVTTRGMNLGGVVLYRGEKPAASRMESAE